MRVLSTKTCSADRLKILVYGQSGAGKTTLAGTLREPCLVISAEAGLLSLAKSNLDFIDLSQDDAGELVPISKRTMRLGKVFEYVAKKETQEKYKWLFIDSLTEIGQNIFETVSEIWTDKKDTLNLWNDYDKKARAMVKSFRDLPHYNVVFTALDKEDKDENNRRLIRPEMQGRTGKQLTAYFDEVFWLTINEKNERKILTNATETIKAKDRSGKLTQWVGADLQAIADQIRSGTQLELAPQQPITKKTEEKKNA